MSMSLTSWSLAALALLGCDGGLAGQGTAPDAAVDAASAPRSPLSAGMTAVDFGCVGLGKPVAYRALIENTALSPVGPLDVGLAPSSPMLLILADGCGGLTLEAGESCIISLFFMADTSLELEATLEVTAPQGAPLRLSVRAASSPLGDKMDGVQPTTLDFGTVEVGSATPVMALQLRNLADEASTAPAATLASGGAFQITADECAGRPVPPLGSCGVAVRFAPRTAGKHTDELRLGPGKACDPFPPITLTGTAR
jgi:hypothetical protein